MLDPQAQPPAWERNERARADALESDRKKVEQLLTRVRDDVRALAKLVNQLEDRWAPTDDDQDWSEARAVFLPEAKRLLEGLPAGFIDAGMPPWKNPTASLRAVIAANTLASGHGPTDLAVVSLLLGNRPNGGSQRIGELLDAEAGAMRKAMVRRREPGHEGT